MDDEFYTKILEENKADVIEKVRQAMFEGIEKKFSWELPKVVSDAVDDFVRDEVVPEIRSRLLEDKEAIIDAATAMIRQLPAEIGKAMQEKVAENLSSSWKLEKVVHGLLD